MINYKRLPMIEVFKTNVENHDQAIMLLDRIHQAFADYKANFDLQDCDKILRVKSSAHVQADCLINVLKDFGFHAEVLPDERQPVAVGYTAEKY
jgi:hypothetical protein